MAEQLRAVRGMHDILPPTSAHWAWLERQVYDLLTAYGYRELRTPLLESSALFQRSIGEVTDIVEKEMYSFADRGGDDLSLRPEGTASCVRAAIEHGLLNQPQRLWYQGAMFRRERPQRGRYRQFHQIGVETFGLTGPDIDLELILLTHRLWQQLGLSAVRLEINSLGDSHERVRYRADLLSYLEQHQDALDEDSQRRMVTNPLRVLDSKNPAMQSLIAGAPTLLDYLGEESKAHFAALCAGLDRAEVAYQINPRLVRGLDYYNRTVFEWITASLGAQGTICAGGRYDGLVEQLGGRPTPAVGFAMGLERLLELIPKAQLHHAERALHPDLYLIAVGAKAEAEALVLAERLRSQCPTLQLLCHCGGGSFKSQFKKADRSGATAALVLGDQELAAGTIGYKPLRADAQQQPLALASLGETLPALLKSTQKDEI